MARPQRGVGLRVLLPAAFALAALSLLGPAQPAYDPWAWLLWGREVAHGTLSTVDGPAFKPLPVLVTALLSPLGEDVAPALWVLVGRTGAVAGVLLAAGLAWRLAGPLAGVVAALAVLGLRGWLWHGAVGNAEGLLVALVLAAAWCAVDGRHGRALGLSVAAALVRVEAWPFLLAYVLWRRERAGLVVLAVPVLWFGPELWGSGDPWRSGARAQVPNPGQPATAAVPALASLEAALLLATPLAALAALAPRGTARLLAAGGAAWVAIVALMAQLLGTSGEPRYALPGVAVLAVPAGVAAARHRRALAVGALATLLVAPVRLASHGRELERVADEAQLWASLPDAVAAAGGAAVLARCGRPATGRYRGTAVAYALRVPKARVLAPGTGAVVLRSRLRRGLPVEPAGAGRVSARSARWEVRTRC